MAYVKLGRTGIVSMKNAFGALPIQRVSIEYAGELLRKAFEAGITYFDTARAYTDSEEKIGLALSDVRDKIVIATKTEAENGEDLRRDLAESLRLLKTDYIDVYQLHNTPFCPKPGDGSELCETLLEAKAQGKIKHIGFTNHRPDVAEEAVKSGFFDTLQFPFCYLATERDIALVKLCKEMDVGFIAMKGLSGGMLTRSDAAFAWLDQFDNVLPIWGVQREWELDEFLSYIDNPPEMTEEIKAHIENDRKELLGNFCRSCGYCMPCPVGIEIRNCARMSQLIRRSPSADWLTDEWQARMMNVENCIGCGKCKTKCPYGLDIPELLKLNLADYKDILAGRTEI